MSTHTLDASRPAIEPIGLTRWRAWGTSVTLGVQPARALGAARAILRQEIDDIDRTCSRFREDSEVSGLARSDGSAVRVSRLLFEAIDTACLAAARTGGAVDPTVGAALSTLGYDRDFDLVAAERGDLARVPQPCPGWEAVALDRASRRVTLPAGVLLDLGATAKALCADHAVRRIAGATGAGVLVDLGGDVAIAGPTPDGGWRIAVVEDARSEHQGSDHVVSVQAGGIASSGTAVRVWNRGDHALHHIIDPATGWPAPAFWRLATVAAATCVDANTASTAAIVWGDDAPRRLKALGLPSRLVHRDGTVLTLGGWPA